MWPARTVWARNTCRWAEYGCCCGEWPVESNGMLMAVACTCGRHRVALTVTAFWSDSLYTNTSHPTTHQQTPSCVFQTRHRLCVSMPSATCTLCHHETLTVSILSVLFTSASAIMDPSQVNTVTQLPRARSEHTANNPYADHQSPGCGRFAYSFQKCSI